MSIGGGPVVCCRLDSPKPWLIENRLRQRLVMQMSGQFLVAKPSFFLASKVVSFVHRKYMPLPGSSKRPHKNGSTYQDSRSDSLVSSSMGLGLGGNLHKKWMMDLTKLVSCNGRSRSISCIIPLSRLTIFVETSMVLRIWRCKTNASRIKKLVFDGMVAANTSLDMFWLLFCWYTTTAGYGFLLLGLRINTGGDLTLVVLWMRFRYCL